jgi:hypothetical protein
VAPVSRLKIVLGQTLGRAMMRNIESPPTISKIADYYPASSVQSAARVISARRAVPDRHDHKPRQRAETGSWLVWLGETSADVPQL